MASRHYAEFEILDYSESKSSFSFNFGAITAVSLPGFLTDFGNFRTALDNITLGTIRRERWTGDETILSNVPPADSLAQRELAWLVRYIEITGEGYPGVAALATPDLSLLSAVLHDHADYGNATVQAFITAFEAIAVSQFGNPVEVESITLLGRDR